MSYLKPVVKQQLNLGNKTDEGIETPGLITN